MNILIWLAVKAFVACVILTPIFRDIFRSYRIVDRPDSRRKVHIYPIPRVGGIPIAVAYAFALYPFTSKSAAALSDHSVLAWKLAPAALLMFATGLIDDLWGLKAWQKFIGQIAAASLACWAGVRVFGVAGYTSASFWTIPLTIIWLVACANAFNLVDGLDGLAAGMGLVGALTLTFAALMHGLSALAYVSVPLAGALLGFLCYNFNPATVFLGDSGALLIGFLLGCYGALWTQKSATLIGIMIPLLAVAIPMLDVLLAVLRRFLRNEPIFAADRRHIHHRLLDRGLTPRRAVLVLYLVCAAGAAFGLVMTVPYGGRYAGFALLALCGITIMGIRELRYAEFGMVGRILFGGELQRTLHGQIGLERLAEDLRSTAGADQCWAKVSAAARSFGFTSVRMCFQDITREEVFPHIDEEERWTVHAPLGPHEWIELARPFDSGVQPMMVGAFIDTLRRALVARTEERKQPVS